MTPKFEAGPGRRVVAMPAGCRTRSFRGHGPPELQDPGRPLEFMLDGRHYRLVPVEAEDQGGALPLPAAEVLTARELQIVALVAEGRVNKQIADVLRISEWTVSTHLRRVFAKLRVDTRAAMVSRCCGLPVPPRRGS